MAGSSSVQAAALASWNFDTQVQDNTAIYDPIAADIADPLVVVGDLTRGAGITHFLVRTYNSQPVMRFVNGPGVNSYVTALSGDFYVEFSVAPIPGYQMDLTSLTFDAWRAGGAQARKFFVWASTDDFDNVAWEIIPETFGPPAADPPAAAVANLSLAEITDAVQFRIYGFNTGTQSADRALQYDNIVINGTVSQIVPEPSQAMAGLMVSGFLGGSVMRRRRKV
ncbi:MAG: hypothetical protein RLZZ179_225 [Verrucomicrobiota bacterium]|jgi:hypothetical protein